MKGYKAMKSDMTCKGFKYETGRESVKRYNHS